MKTAGSRTSKVERPRQHGDRQRTGRSSFALFIPALAVLFFSGWIGFAASVKADELLTGIPVIALLTLFTSALLRSEWQPLRFEPGDLLQCWRVPWYVLSGCWEITAMLARDLFLRRRAGSYYRKCSFRIHKHDPVLLARTVLAVTYTTMAPNFIVIGIDDSQRQMLFHQIERSSVPRMSQRLGAQMESQP
jgi:multisubunit Na+/H+ antiporter MnhE subunit